MIWDGDGVSPLSAPNDDFWRLRNGWRREDNGQWFRIAQPPVTVLVPKDVHLRISKCDAFQAPVTEPRRDPIRPRRRGSFTSLRSWLAQRKIVGEH